MISSSSRFASRPEFLQRALHEADQIAVAELHGRQIDREAHLGPAGGLGAGHAQHLFAEEEDQSGFLRDGDELLGWHPAPLGMMPARERLDADRLLAAGIDLKLIVDLELTAHERRSQVALERPARL